MSAMAGDQRPTQDRILFLLKTKGELTAQALGERLGITAMGVRQHLYRLQEDDLVTFRDERAGVGRPSRHWHLTETGNGRFPDGHSELAVAMLKSIEDLFGADGLDRLITARTSEMQDAYGQSLNGCRSIEQRIAGLVELRSKEGYMAEWRKEDDGSYLLAENHCPICAAAKVCQGLCRSELEVFQSALGDQVTVERTSHILAGARRCAYRITPKAKN
ncbi:MAG: metalloregulator ArsR/SmtB family transcription factor [Pseudomonadota bacterium]